MTSIKVYAADSVPLFSTRTATTKTFLTYDLSNAVTDVDWKLTMLDQPGEMNVSFLSSSQSRVKINIGSNIVLEVDGVVRFNGFIFKTSYNDSDNVSIKAYDRTRYLQGKDSFAFNNESLRTMFDKLCQVRGIKRLIKWGPYTTLPSHVFDNTSLFDMLKWGIDQTLVLSNELYVIYDNGGTLVLDNVRALDTDILFGDGLSLTGYNFERSIDSETFNVIKLVREATDSHQREVVVKYDQGTVATWGQLQYYEKVKDEISLQQMNDKASKLLNLYNRESKTLRIQTIGIPNIIAGSGIGIRIGGLGVDGLSKGITTFVNSVHHQISGGDYTMSLEVALP